MGLTQSAQNYGGSPFFHVAFNSVQINKFWNSDIICLPLCIQNNRNLKISDDPAHKMWE